MIEIDDLFFDPAQPIEHLEGNLPHWRQEGVLYFVTFRLADAISQDKLRQWREEKTLWQKRNPTPHSSAQRREFWKRFPARFHRWLDANCGACLLAQPPVADLMYRVLKHFDAKRYELGEHVVMPNHVHAVLLPRPGYELSDIIHTWKSYSASRINRLTARQGKLWQKEYFDHIVRSPEQLDRINTYIRENPQLKGS